MLAPSVAVAWKQTGAVDAPGGVQLKSAVAVVPDVFDTVAPAGGGALLKVTVGVPVFVVAVKEKENGCPAGTVYVGGVAGSKTSWMGGAVSTTSISMSSGTKFVRLP